jgi:hypothetical protein
VSVTYLRVDDRGRYQACELVAGRFTVDLPVEPLETAREACDYVAVRDGRAAKPFQARPL